MKKALIAALLIAAAPSAATAQSKGIMQTWGLCGTEFPGLGFLGRIFLLPCRVPMTPSNA